MRLDYQSAESLAPVVEALLFASDEPLSADDLRAIILGEELQRAEPELPLEAAASDDALDLPPSPEPTLAASSLNDDAPVAAGPPDGTPGRAPERKRRKKQLIELPALHEAIKLLNEQYDASGRAFRIVEIAFGYQFATRPDYSEYVARLFKEKSRRRLSSAALETLAIVAYKQPVSKGDIENIRGVNCDEVLKSLLEKNLVTITGRAEAVGRPLLYGTTIDFLRHFGLHTLSDLPRPREIEEMMKEESVRATTLEEAATEFVTTASAEEEITMDEAIAVARELSEREEADLPDEDMTAMEVEIGIGLDLASIEELTEDTNGQSTD
jgi:segregation and condensation protein B